MNRRADFVIIGSGIAGLRAAVDLAARGDVVLLTKADPTESNTGYAQGGIAAAVGPDDHPDLHFADTMAAGDGLCAAAAVRVLVDEGPRYVRELTEWGVRFDRSPDGAIALAREAAHAVRRVLHAADATGREIGRALWNKARQAGRIEVLNHTRAVALIVEDGACAGVRYVRAGGGREHGGEVRARGLLLATGGAGQVFSDTTNPPIATGDGVCLAWQAGARVADLEFVQFHPTALNVPGSPRVLLSEALRGEGARLVNVAGERFTGRYEPAGDLASRDRVSRAIVREVARTGQPVFLSLQHLDATTVHARFPTASAACRAVGLDLARDRIPVGPAAHYVMGGVETDLWGRTTLPGLFAAGEVACTGVHGANRLASNSLLEGLVFGARAAAAMQERPYAGALAAQVRDWTDAPADVLGDPAGPGAPGEDEIRRLMWDAVGLVRDGRGLEQAVTTLSSAIATLDTPPPDGASEADWRRRSLVTVGWLIARAALRRAESRGGHFRADFPQRDDVHWSAHIVERSRHRSL
ncbi:MAG: L-aspartate oxidase [Acidobacteria bacterium]|nr:L-aspartate oxidase [Acidobacteriota bacterium]